MRKMATTLLAVLAMACGSSNDSVTGPVVAVGGTYALQSVDGQKLPYLLYQQDVNSITVLDGQLAVATDGTWTEIVNLRNVSGTDTTTQAATAAGTWFQSGSALVFLNGGDNSTYYTGTASANRLDLDAGVVSIVYAK